MTTATPPISNPLTLKLEQLRLTTIRQRIEQTINDAADANLSFASTLERLIDLELEARRQRSVERQVKQSKLQSPQSIDAFQFAYHKSRQQAKARILKLLDLDFVRRGANIVLVGNPGTGKTMLAKIIALEACQNNFRVLFTTAMDMLNQLLASQVDHSLVRKIKSYTDPALLVVDELGYLALDQNSSNLLYQVISARHASKRSTVITTNTAFSEWGNILHNTTIATAIADRLVENSEVFLLGGDSFRKHLQQQTRP